MIKKDWDGYGAKYEAKFGIFSRIMLSGGQKHQLFAWFCAYFQILHSSLPDSAKNSMGAESQNPGGTDTIELRLFILNICIHDWLAQIIA